MLPPEVEYVKKQIINHLMLFFERDVLNLFYSGFIRFLPYDEAIAVNDRTVVIPFDIPMPFEIGHPFNVGFNGTNLTLWNRIPPPDGGFWKGIPNEAAPLWYQNPGGTLIPAWNLFGNLFQLLTFGEERATSKRDAHGRYAAVFSPRSLLNLIEVPAFNEAVAALVGAADGLRRNAEPSYELERLIRPAIIVLSHDCDILRGNDFWTQSVRLLRIFQPLLKARLPKIGNAWWMVRNAFTPRRFYFDNVTGMIDLERCFGFKSTFYLLNGSGGRFGARSGSAIMPDVLANIPDDWNIGMHYNYDTFLNEECFSAQLAQLQEIAESEITTGRAHYLKFDPERSFPFLCKHGINVDESSGYADRIGYRNGIGGCFQVFNPEICAPLDIWEVPMVVMDAVLVRQYGDKAVNKFSELVSHLSRIGGALTLIFHPGQFFNPEYGQMLGIYHKILIACRQSGIRSRTARSLVDEIRSNSA
nr:hypothetical protein [candidate division Zixibacteria bacterium]